MRRTLTCFITATIVLGAIAVSFIADTQSAEAIPAFARKYRMSCWTCHEPTPRLKPYGDDFAGNGFVLKDQDAPRYYVDTGDEDLSLIREFPIAVRMDGFLKYESRTDRNVDLSSPYILKLLSGGSLADDLAYYFYFYFSEHGEIAGVEDAYLMFNNLFDSELDVYLGQFQVSDPLFKRELRLTYEDYQIYKTSVGESRVSLAYDRGIMLTYGFENGPDVIAEIVNGNGLSEADSYLVYDDDKYKCFAGRISQDVTEYGRVGAFGYWGREESDADNEVWYIGGDASVGDGKFIEVNGQFLERRDSDPLFTGLDDAEKVETRGVMAEAIITPKGQRSPVYLVGLVNWVDSDYDHLKYRTGTAHIGYMLRTNLRLTGEVTYDFNHEEVRIVTGFVGGF